MSRFVSAGTSEDPPQRDAEWIEAQKEIEAAQLRKKQESNPDDGRSLYEVLQANKAAKQEAFEEAAKLKNQFRSLDDDEVDFLDSVLESTRAKEEAVKKETTEQLELFRRQREEAEKAGLGLGEDQAAVEAPDQEPWTASGARKRKKGADKGGLKGLKIRRSSSAAEVKETGTTPKLSNNKLVTPKPTQQAKPPAAETKPIKSPNSRATTEADGTTPLSASAKTTAPKSLGLAAYSDSEDD